jgi:CBS domain containing-hemolysin-like protein
VLQSISDKLFMGSLILLMISAVVSGIGFQFASFRNQVDEDPGEQVKDKNRKHIAIDKQDRSLRRFFRSYLMWISLVGMAVSILLSYM